MAHKNGKVKKANAAAKRGMALSAARLEKVEAWGGASYGVGWVFRPTTAAQIADIYALAASEGVTVTHRGGGNSYGDAAYNEGGIVIDLTRMDRVLAWDPTTGVISAEPGLTLRRLWEYTVEDGWWPPVCTGTAHVTLGGMAAMNVHGKNAYRLGTIGDHIVDFDLLLPDGRHLTCSRDENADLFHAAIGGAGLLGCFTRFTLQLKRIYSGYIAVDEWVSRDLSEMFAQFRRHLDESDYLVGWVDGTARRSLGRGQIHRGLYVPEGADPQPARSLRVKHQHLPDTMFGVIPKSIMWLFMRPFFNNAGVPLINFAKYTASRLGHGSRHQWTHPQFHFLLDYAPHWKRAYGPGGLIQYQPFVPDGQAERVFQDILRLTQRRGLPTYLGVLKRHKPDPFWLTHGLDGWSLAMDFRVTPRNRHALVNLARELDDIVLDAGGRFYFAKDSTLTPAATQAYLGEDVLARFSALKAQCDPEGILESNLWRRVAAT